MKYVIETPLSPPDNTLTLFKEIEKLSRKTKKSTFYVIAKIHPIIERMQQEETVSAIRSLARIYDHVESGHYPEACDALKKLIDDAKPIMTAHDVLEKFDRMLSIDKGKYKGHSVGFEIEFFAHRDEVEEVRSGPFLNIDQAMESLRIAQHLSSLGGSKLYIEEDEIRIEENHIRMKAKIDSEKTAPKKFYADDAEYATPMATLHINFGMTSKSIQNFNSNSKVYKSIINKISYLANSSARNLKGSSHIQEKDDIIKVSGLISHRQIARLECKNFCLAPDGDFAMLRPFILAFWIALDSPAKAIELNASLDTIFNDAGILQQLDQTASAGNATSAC